MMKRIYLSTLFLIGYIVAQAQIVTLSPPFPTVDDDVTITYDATQGSGGLVGESPVYMHSGVLTSTTTGWQYVVGNWGEDNGLGEMTDIGNDKHSITINIRDYYGIPQGVEVTDLAMVFRNADGSAEGKTEDFQDIFVPIYSDNSQLLIAFSSPAEETVLLDAPGGIPVNVNTSTLADISLTDNGAQVEMAANTNNLQTSINATVTGEHEVIAIATNGTETVSDTFHYILNPAVTTAEPPAGTQHGINVLNTSSVVLQLWAPNKDYVYVIGDFNDWQPDLDYYMHRSADGATWWLQIDGLSPNEEYAFQYFVDGDIRVGDPYSEKVLDRWNDPWIDEETYPNLKPYPNDKTTGIVTAFSTAPDDFQWTDNDYERPDQTELFIYELLLRDFVETHDYQTLLDSLDYLENLGVNAIQLMPVNEFEGNISWGYNPSFHIALDKYYGTPEAFKTFVNECHNRGIAVIVDIVLNHAFSQNPLCQLYWNDADFRPAPDNPWLNETPRHDFNVGYDFDHEAQATKDYTDRVVTYWLDEYHIDGYRFDLSKGFTQNNTLGDVGAWGQYDASRIGLLKRIADVMWAESAGAYVILEHFAVQSEEKELADYGMMLWANTVNDFNEATMGFPSNLSNMMHNAGSHQFNSPHAVGYWESHDEERLAYKNQQFGNSSNANHDAKDLDVTLKRMEAAAVIMLTAPGPKMIWQFGELGYDFSINYCEDGSINNDCRTGPKPIRWDYFEDPNRKALYEVMGHVAQLRQEYPEAFHSDNFDYFLAAQDKRVRVFSDDLNVVAVANFSVVNGDVYPQFPQGGWWYEYFTGDSLNVTDPNAPINFNPGEYRLYSDKPMTLEEEEEPPVSIRPTVAQHVHLDIYPNPSPGMLNLELHLSRLQEVSLELLDVTGTRMASLYQGHTDHLQLQEDLGGSLTPGIYFIQVQTEGGVHTQKWVVK